MNIIKQKELIYFVFYIFDVSNSSLYIVKIIIDFKSFIKILI